MIGHASLNERGGITGGTAGDQTGREVLTGNWYNHPWSVMLRPTDATQANKMATACEQGCKNDKIGYDQNRRNSLNTQASKVGYDLSKITVACDCDCSSFMSVCAQAAGINIPYSSGNAPTTSTMRNAFTSMGRFTAYTDSKYLTSDKYLKRGDILVKPGSHTVMNLTNGSLSGTTTSSSGSSSTTSTTNYTVGNTYTTVVSNLNVRVSPGTSSATKTKSQLTADGQKHSNAKGQLNSSTVVTCKEIQKIGNDIWMRTPSGWIAAYYNGEHYVR